MATAPNFPRIVIDHARYWRGAQHVWSTNYFFGGGAWADGEAQDVIDGLLTMESASLFTAPNVGGGFLETRAYNAVLGAPVLTDTYGTLETPSTWVPYTGTDWGTEGGALYETAAEVALIVDTPLAGLSTTGKPVKSTKYFHSVAHLGDQAAGAADITGSVLTAMETSLAVLTTGLGPNSRRMISNGGRFPSGAPTVRPFFGNHQMPQGRRKKKVTSSGTILTRLLKVVEANPELAALELAADA